MRAISVEDLKPGMVIARTLTNADRIVILSEGTEVTPAHITRLTFLNIAVVYIKDDEELKEENPAILMRGNIFVKKYESIVHDAEEIFADVKQGGTVPMEKTNKVVDNDLSPMSRTSGAIDYLYELNHLASDVYNHSLRVSILAGVIAKWMHYDEAKCKDIIRAGFLHDIGKTKFSQRLLEKNVSTLKGEDYEAYINHTVDGHHILSELPDVSEGVKLAAMQHHERMDGSGFPFNCVGKDIHEYARIVAIADIYDNITTEREGYVKQTPFAAIAYITENMFSTLDPAFCVPVLTHIKDAFLGSVVLLSNGCKGTITAFPNDFAAHPIVTVSRDEIYDLNEHPEILIIEYNPK